MLRTLTEGAPRGATGMTTETTRTALDAYMEHHAAALALVERIHDAIENHDDAPAEGLAWGHVGDIVETERQLQEIADRLFPEG